jgi:hypothetical protein
LQVAGLQFFSTFFADFVHFWAGLQFFEPKGAQKTATLSRVAVFWAPLVSSQIPLFEIALTQPRLSFCSYCAVFSLGWFAASSFAARVRLQLGAVRS